MVIVGLIGLGLVLGSFGNATIWRLYMQREGRRKAKRMGLSGNDLSIVRGRSLCTHCGHPLAAWDLVPVVSYIYLRGRCRYCRKPIEDTPLAEILLPLLFVASYIWWPYALTADNGIYGRALFVLWLAALVCFVILAVYDIRWLLLPDRVVFPLIGIAVIAVILRVTILHEGLNAIAVAGWGVLLTAGVFYALHTLSQGKWIGFGDVKLAVALGMLVGGPLPALLLIFIASLAGSLAAIPLLLQGRPAGSTRIPFGPFLLLATVVVVLFGAALSQWYTSLLVP